MRASERSRVDPSYSSHGGLMMSEARTFRLELRHSLTVAPPDGGLATFNNETLLSRRHANKRADGKLAGRCTMEELRMLAHEKSRPSGWRPEVLGMAIG